MRGIRRLFSDEHGGLSMHLVPILSLVALAGSLVTAFLGGDILTTWWEFIKVLF